MHCNLVLKLSTRTASNQTLSRVFNVAQCCATLRTVHTAEASLYFICNIYISLSIICQLHLHFQFQFHFQSEFVQQPQLHFPFAFYFEFHLRFLSSLFFLLFLLLPNCLFFFVLRCALGFIQLPPSATFLMIRLLPLWLRQ